MFWLVGLGWPRWSSWRVVGVAAGFALAIELSQLCHTPWLMQLRATRLGALVLGHGFLWSDLACYGVGILAGVGLEGLVGKSKRQPPSLPPSMEAEN
ncbi:DUF2809 domain-containing protein [Hymenobacter sp. AT01-02]|uniref:ribosomal maturation YjgA family protein n=1 Tax=Hymenobacter sp. AT01-02 TaxID=1571877 RepID=UPI0039774BFD